VWRCTGGGSAARELAKKWGHAVEEFEDVFGLVGAVGDGAVDGAPPFQATGLAGNEDADDILAKWLLELIGDAGEEQEALAPEVIFPLQAAVGFFPVHASFAKDVLDEGGPLLHKGFCQDTGVLGDCPAAGFVLGKRLRVRDPQANIACKRHV
jgi:hypothetical protein